MGPDSTELYTQLLNDEKAIAQQSQLGEWGTLLDPYWDYVHNGPLGW